MTRKTKPMADPMEELVKQLGDDQEIHDETRAIMILALREARKILRIGLPQEKSALVRHLVGLSSKLTAGKEQEDDSIVEMRREMAKLMAEIRGE